MENMTGKVWILGDDIDTDIIIPTEYLAMKTIDDMKQYAFSPLRPELAGQIQKGDIIVAGKNFGCGSSREQAPEIIKALGIQCVIAKSFARIFFRNAINNGLLLIEQPDLYDDICRPCSGGTAPGSALRGSWTAGSRSAGRRDHKRYRPRWCWKR